MAQLVPKGRLSRPGRCDGVVRAEELRGETSLAGEGGEKETE